ncbi:MAG: FAD-dependent oxidoreductase [Verrucomicrobiales bacterium]|nr:FAD-dependent oxidoreductase [Verrucomicrobiales bacterium]
MNRRDFLSLATASTTCSLWVNLNGWGADVSTAKVAAPDFDAVAPVRPSSSPLPHDPHLTVVDLACDVFIAGGGMAGVCAALAAARQGTKVVLVQDRSRLGGNSSSEVKMHIVGADIHGARPGWREGGILEELRLDDAVANPQRSREMWDLLLYDKLVSEPNITLLLDTTCVGVEAGDGVIHRAHARCDKTEHFYRVAAKQFADCTGDCRLGVVAGAEIRRGREAKSEFNESLAVDRADQATLGSTILFTARDYGRPVPFIPPSWARKVTKDMLRLRPIHSWEYGYWWVEWGGALDTIRDNERIRFQLLAITLGVWDYIKNSGEHPSSAHWALDWLGMVPGKRGSRRMVGDHILTEHDLMGRQGEPPDAVAMGGWGMDDHPPGGFDRPDLPPFKTVPPPHPYNIPLRCLYSRNVANLWMAGRNISASHVAFTSTRVMATCAVMGQAVGTAAAYCVQHQLRPRQLAQSPSDIQALQQRLLRDDQTIRGRRNEDPGDLAKKAEVTASGSVAEADPANVINGWVRDLPGRWENRWGALLGPEGVWLQLTWKDAPTLSQVQLCFDTGFQRELTLSQQDSVNAKVIRAPQPETVRDYQLQAQKPGSSDWTTLVEVRNNHQRLRRHTFEPLQVSALRLRISATQGSDTARLYEIRCYA